MSPEQLRSSKDVDGRADVWSLGVVLFELLTRRWPFDGESSGAIFAAVLETTPPDPRAFRPEIPTALAAAMLRCLSRDRDRRTADVAELADSIAPFGSAAAAELARRVRAIAGVRRSNPEPLPSTMTMAAAPATTAPLVRAAPRIDVASLFARQKTLFERHKTLLTRVAMGAGALLALLLIVRFAMSFRAKGRGLAAGSVVRITTRAGGRCIAPGTDRNEKGATPLLLAACNRYLPEQRFRVFPDGTLLSSDARCMDVVDAAFTDGAVVQLFPCHSGLNQHWDIDLASGEIRAKGVQLCLAAGDERLKLRACDGGDAQSWMGLTPRE